MADEPLNIIRKVRCYVADFHGIELGESTYHHFCYENNEQKVVDKKINELSNIELLQILTELGAFK
jgi:hypothetical protein